MKTQNLPQGPETAEGQAPQGSLKQDQSIILPDNPELQHPVRHNKKRLIIGGTIAGIIFGAACIAAGYWYIANHTFTQKVTTSEAQTKPADPYAGWKTYNDVGYAAASGIRLK